MGWPEVTEALASLENEVCIERTSVYLQDCLHAALVAGNTLETSMLTPFQETSVFSQHWHDLSSQLVATYKKKNALLFRCASEEHTTLQYCIFCTMNLINKQAQKQAFIEPCSLWKKQQQEMQTFNENKRTSIHFLTAVKAHSICDSDWITLFLEHVHRLMILVSKFQFLEMCPSKQQSLITKILFKCALEKNGHAYYETSQERVR